MKLILILIFSLLFTLELHARKRPPKIYQNQSVETETPYLFDIKPLLLDTDKIYLDGNKSIELNNINDLNRLFLWTTPTMIPGTAEILQPNADVFLSYPMYTTFPTDQIFESPLTPLLSSPRKALYGLEQYGFSTNIIALYIGQLSADNLSGKKDKAGFFGFEAYSNWILNSSDMGISSVTFELGYQYNLHKTEDRGKSVGSIITSNVILGDSGPIIGDIYYTQGFLNNKVLVHAGRLTPWYYYGYNTFTDSETDAFMSEMFSGSVTVPQGGGNGSQPGISIQYFIDEHFYLTSALTNTEGKSGEFDFDIFNKDAYFVGTEFGYLSKGNHLNSRISFGLHQAKVKQGNGERKTGNGFNFMFEQELTPKGFSPYVGTFFQYEYSDKEIALATQQISGGIAIRHPFHRRGDSFGWGVGTVKPSDSKLRREYFSDSYYRLQLTQNLQWSFNLQLYIKPSLSEKDIAPVFNTRVLFTF